MERLGRDGGCTLSLHKTQGVPGDTTSDLIGSQVMGRGDSCTALSSSSLTWPQQGKGQHFSRGKEGEEPSLDSEVPKEGLDKVMGGPNTLIPEAFAQPHPRSRFSCDPFRLQSTASSSPPSQPKEGDTQPFWGHSVLLNTRPSSTPFSIRSESPSGSSRRGLGGD